MIPYRSDGRQCQRREPEGHEQRAEGAVEPGVQRILVSQRTHPVERERGIDLVDLVLDGGGVALRVLLGPNGQAHEVDDVLRQRDVDALVTGIVRADGASQIQVRHDPHDGPPRGIALPQLHPAPERIAPREQQLGEPFVDDGDRLGRGTVSPREDPPPNGPHADDVEVAGRDDDPAGKGMVLWRGVGDAVDRDRLQLAATGRQVGRQGHGANAGPALQTSRELVVETQLRIPGRVVLFEQAQTRGENVGRREAVVEAGDVDDGPDHQAR